MREVMETMWLLQAVEAIGFCDFLFQKKKIRRGNGFVLVVEDDWQARQLEDALIHTVCAQRVKKGVQPKNFEIGIWRYHKYDRAPEVEMFLESTSFFPILIVSGMVPETVTCVYTFKCNFNSNDVAAYAQMYHRMKTLVLEHTDHILYEMEHIAGLHIFEQYKVAEKFEDCFQVLVAAGKVWEMIMRECNDEYTAERWFKGYCRCAAEALEQMEDLSDDCEIGDIFAEIVVRYVRENDVSMCPLKNKLVTEHTETIYYSEDAYYFSEPFLKEICKPIARTVSFAQVKRELREEGILLCNTCKNGNLTVKLSFVNETGEIIRKRFLKIDKESVVSEEGLLLEELYDLKQEWEGN